MRGRFWLCLAILSFLGATTVRAEDWALPASCSSGHWGEECTHGNGGSDSMSDEDQWITVHTDSPTPLQIRYRMSRTPDDFNCEQAQRNELTMMDHFAVSTETLWHEKVDFARQWRPGNALYEWHICFLVDGTVYRGWRGFDPGPGAKLNIQCTLTMAQLRAHDADRYVCATFSITPAPVKDEYALYCEAKNCLHFPTQAEYDAWHKFNPLPPPDQDAIAAAVLTYSTTNATYLGQNSSFPFYISIRGRDASPSLLKTLNKAGWHAFPGSADRKAGMQVGVGFFIADAADSAHGVVGAYCGPTCAGSESFTVRKTGGVWRVTAHQMRWVS
jgi:hypothetical protein